MRARRRLIYRRASSVVNRRSSKILEAAPIGDGRWETGSANTAISEEEQNQQDRLLAPEGEAMALDHTSDGPALSTLTSTPSQPNGGAGGGTGPDNEARDGRGGNSRTQEQQQLSYHPDAECAEAVGYAGHLSSLQQVCRCCIMHRSCHAMRQVCMYR